MPINLPTFLISKSAGQLLEARRERSYDGQKAGDAPSRMQVALSIRSILKRSEYARYPRGKGRDICDKDQEELSSSRRASSLQAWLI